MRKVIVIFLSLLLAVAMMAGCQPSAPTETEVPVSEEPVATEEPAAPVEEEPATEEKTTEGMKIAYMVSELSNEFHQARAEAAKQYALEAYGAEVIVVDGKSDDNVQIQNVDLLVTSDFDGASLQIWSDEAAEASIKAAIDAGIAMTSFFSPIETTGIPCVQSDEAGGSFAMGKSAAEQWVAAHPDIPITTIQIGWPDLKEVIDGRTAPFVAGIESVVGKGNYTDLGCLGTNSSADAAKEGVASALATNPEINIIYSEAGNLTPGTMDALKDIGRGVMENNVPLTEIVCSVDCPVSEMKDIFDPTSSLKMSLGLPPIETSKTIIDTIVAVYLGEIAQVSNPNEVIIASAKPIDGYSISMADALAWYNEQFGTALTEADLAK